MKKFINALNKTEEVVLVAMFALMVAMGVSWKMKIIARGCGHFLGTMLPTLNSYDTA